MHPPDEVVAFYARGLEDARLLQDGRGWLERARTQELLERFLPRPPAVVLDVGGGTGHYALWLAERDYEVHLIEPVPLHLEQAQRRSSQASRQLASIRSGDARAIDLPDGFADAVLLLGPLYHLVDRAERLSALGEARRVVRPGGVVMTAVISRFASALDGLLQHFFDDPAYRAIVRHDLADGQHRGVVPEHASTQTYFTTAYLHRPDEIADELLEAGLDHEATLAIEGPGWLLQDLDQQWQDPVRREAILEVVRAAESEPSLTGVSAHLLAVARANG